MADQAKGKRPRRTQAERRATTQAALLDATIDCLVEYGYSNTTTTKVVERAGVSRGAQVHHFPTKAELVAAAVAHLAERRMEQLRAEAKRLPRGRDRVTAALDLLFETYRGRLYEATVELWVASRTDPELRSSLVPVETQLLDHLSEQGRSLFGDYSQIPDFDTKLATSVNAIQGYALLRTLFGRGDQKRSAAWRRRRAQLARMFENDRPATPT